MPIFFVWTLLAIIDTIFEKGGFRKLLFARFRIKVSYQHFVSLKNVYLKLSYPYVGVIRDI